MNDSQLADKARAVARCLSYSGNQHEEAAKKNFSGGGRTVHMREVVDD